MSADIEIVVKIVAIAFAVGLDVLAISVAVGVMRLGTRQSVRLGVAFAIAEIAMQVIGYELGAEAGAVLGVAASYASFVLLAIVGLIMLRSSFSDREEKFDATRGAGMLMTALSISLDSLGVGIALPGIGVPLLPLLVTVSITTTLFTLIGLSFGARLGTRYESAAERLAGAMLIVLALGFSIQQLW